MDRERLFNVYGSEFTITTHSFPIWIVHTVDIYKSPTPHIGVSQRLPAPPVAFFIQALEEESRLRLLAVGSKSRVGNQPTTSTRTLSTEEGTVISNDSNSSVLPGIGVVHVITAPCSATHPTVLALQHRYGTERVRVRESLLASQLLPHTKSGDEKAREGARANVHAEMQDFQFALFARTLVLSPSTFGWWAAYLSGQLTSTPIYNAHTQYPSRHTLN